LLRRDQRLGKLRWLGDLSCLGQLSRRIRQCLLDWLSLGGRLLRRLKELPALRCLLRGLGLGVRLEDRLLRCRLRERQLLRLLPGRRWLGGEVGLRNRGVAHERS
jgi:hypothetical protein